MRNDDPRGIREVKKIYIILLIIGGITFVVSSFVSFSICPFYQIIGLPCPSCGMSRAFAALFRLDFAEAFWYHPLFFVVPLIPLLVLRVIPRRTGGVVTNVLIALFLGVWIVRMIWLFPDTPPMDINRDSLLQILWRMIAG